LLKIDFNIKQFSIETLFTNLLDTLIVNEITSQLVLRGILLPLFYVVFFVGTGWYINQRRDV